MKSVLMLGAATLFSIVTGAQDAHACSCLGPGLMTPLPADGAVDVPTNTRLWFNSFGASQAVAELRRTEGEGVPVPVVCSRIQLGASTQQQIAVCAPSEPLLPNTAYSFTADQREVSFTTGNAADDTAPHVPVETDRSIASVAPTPLTASTCGDGEAHYVSLGMDAKDGHLLLVDADESTTLDAANITGSVTVLEAAVPETRVFVGEGACTSNRPTRAGDVIKLRAASFDLAGNFSGWTKLEDAAIPVESPVDPPFGCNSAGAPAAGLCALLALLLRRRG